MTTTPARITSAVPRRLAEAEKIEQQAEAPRLAQSGAPLQDEGQQQQNDREAEGDAEHQKQQELPGDFHERVARLEQRPRAEVLPAVLKEEEGTVVRDRGDVERQGAVERRAVGCREECLE